MSWRPRPTCMSRPDTKSAFLSCQLLEVENSLNAQWSCVYQPLLLPSSEKKDSCPLAQAQTWAPYSTLPCSLDRDTASANRPHTPAPAYQVGRWVWLDTQDLPFQVESKKPSPGLGGPFSAQNCAHRPDGGSAGDSYSTWLIGRATDCSNSLVITDLYICEYCKYSPAIFEDWNYFTSLELPYLLESAFTYSDTSDRIPEPLKPLVAGEIHLL